MTSIKTSTTMSESSNALDAILNIDLRSIDTTLALSSLKKYLKIMEEQIPKVQELEINEIIKSLDSIEDEEDRYIESSNIGHHETIYEEDIIPAMRYSFIVLLHTVLETELHRLGKMIQKERGIKISLSDIEGSPFDKAKTFFGKLAGINISEYKEWNRLKDFQKIRNCIVHKYGSVDKENNEFRKILSKSPNIILIRNRKLSPKAEYCNEVYENLNSFLRRLMSDMGWSVSGKTSEP